MERAQLARAQTLLLALGTIKGISTSSQDYVAAATETIEMFSGDAMQVMWSVIIQPEENAPIVVDRKGTPKPDQSLRDNENVPLPGPVDAYEADPTERRASSASAEQATRDDVDDPCLHSASSARAGSSPQRLTIAAYGGALYSRMRRHRTPQPYTNRYT